MAYALKKGFPVKAIKWSYVTRRALKICTLVALFSTMLFALSSCARSSLPTGAALQDTFSEEFLSALSEMYVDNTPESFSIQNIEVLRQQSSDKNIRSVCCIELSNENYVVESEVELTYEYYDQGGWYMEDWAINDTSVRPLYGISDGQITLWEENLRRYFPDAKYVSRETDLEQTLTDKLYYEIPISAASIGNTGIEITEGGTIGVIYTFKDFGDQFIWQKDIDVTNFFRQWKNCRERCFFNTVGHAGSAGWIDSITINGTSYNLYQDFMDCVIRSNTYGPSVSRQFNIELHKCPLSTAVSDLVPDRYGDYQDAICYFYGNFEYAKYNDDPTEPQYGGCILFTEDGLAIYGQGDTKTDVNGIWTTYYYGSFTFE